MALRPCVNGDSNDFRRIQYKVSHFFILGMCILLLAVLLGGLPEWAAVLLIVLLIVGVISIISGEVEYKLKKQESDDDDNNNDNEAEDYYGEEYEKYEEKRTVAKEPLFATFNLGLRTLRRWQANREDVRPGVIEKLWKKSLASKKDPLLG